MIIDSTINGYKEGITTFIHSSSPSLAPEKDVLESMIIANIAAADKTMGKWKFCFLICILTSQDYMYHRNKTSMPVHIMFRRQVS